MDWQIEKLNMAYFPIFIAFLCLGDYNTQNHSSTCWHDRTSYKKTSQPSPPSFTLCNGSWMHFAATLLHFPSWLRSFAGALASLELELWVVDDEARALLLPATLEMMLTLWCWEEPQVWRKFGFWLEQALLHLPVVLKSKIKYGILGWSEHRFKIISFTITFPKMFKPIGPTQAKKVSFGNKHRPLQSCNLCKRLLGKNFPLWNNLMPN